MYCIGSGKVISYRTAPTHPRVSSLNTSQMSMQGTQTSRILKHFPTTTTLSAGDLLREHISQQTDIGKVAAKYIQDGTLVPDELIVNLVLQELTSSLQGKVCV